MTSFKHIRELGLKVEEMEWQPGHYFHYVRAADLEKLLAGAVRVYGCERKPGEMNREWIAPLTERNEPIGATHTALLIGVEPIVRESEERQLLRALTTADMTTREGYDKYHAAYDRARKLLEERE